MSNLPPSAQNNLIIFTRYPEPGKTKTRLIPTLGEEGAAILQRQLTEYTIREAKKLLNQATISIYYTGKDQDSMRGWLGDDLNYYTQATGNLGDRMQSAFNDAFKKGFSRVIIIGIDCPDLNQTLLQEAFNHLINHDLVLGEAVDGGYYLIGLTNVVPELFQDIPWGTNQVLSLTHNIAKKLNLKLSLLPILPDIDRPEDLAIWQKYQE